MNEQPHDHEFEDFLRRKRPLFRGGEDGPLEPPAELDRIVLRQAREAIHQDQPQRLYHTPRWGAPLAIAATLVLGLTFVFKAGMTTTEVRPQVTVETVAQQAGEPATPAVAATPAAPPAPAETAAAPAPAPAMAARSPVREAPMTTASAQAPRVADSAASPAWRRDAGTWLEEIERLRATGNAAQADAELAEYNRQHRAIAISPDR